MSAPKSGDVQLRRDDAIRVLEQMRAEILATIRSSTAPQTWGAFQLWVLKQEERLAVLEASIAEFRKLDASKVVAVAEGTAL